MTARTSAAWLMILSGLAIVAISVGLTAYLLANPGWLQAQINAQLDAAGPDVREQLAVLDAQMLSRVVLISGALGVVEGGLSMLLGWFVLRGKRWAIRSSIGVTFLRLLLVGLCVLAIVASVALGQPSGGALNAIATFGIAGVFLATLVLLMIARRRMPPPMPTPRP